MAYRLRAQLYHQMAINIGHKCNTFKVFGNKNLRCPKSHEMHTDFQAKVENQTNK